jgi:uncharacterized protein YjbJ (UPF0337 family)
VGNKKDRTTGQIKEKTGEAIGNADLAESGRREQMKGDAKAAAKKVKNVAKKMSLPADAEPALASPRRHPMSAAPPSPPLLRPDRVRNRRYVTTVAATPTVIAATKDFSRDG